MASRYFVWEGGGACIQRVSPPAAEQKLIEVLRRVNPDMREVDRAEYDAAENADYRAAMRPHADD